MEKNKETIVTGMGCKRKGGREREADVEGVRVKIAQIDRERGAFTVRKIEARDKRKGKER